MLELKPALMPPIGFGIVAAALGAVVAWIARATDKPVVPGGVWRGLSVLAGALTAGRFPWRGWAADRRLHGEPRLGRPATVLVLLLLVAAAPSRSAPAAQPDRLAVAGQSAAWDSGAVSEPRRSVMRPLALVQRDPGDAQPVDSGGARQVDPAGARSAAAGGIGRAGMGLLVVVFSGFALALIWPLLHRLLGNASVYLVALLPLAIAIYFGWQLTVLPEGQRILAHIDWVPALGLSLSLMLDPLSLLFGLIIAGVGVLVAIYARGYMAGHRHEWRFHTYMLAFMAAMLGIVLSNNVLALYAFWELTTLTSFLLIGFDHRREAARAAATQALLVTAFGGLAMLAGLVLLGLAGGSYELSDLLTRGDRVRGSPYYPAIVVLVLIGAFTKSAQFPFHFWLPNAMEAPTPVSAYLHSATMVKAGVYVLARLNPVLGEAALWQTALIGFGAVTMILAAYLAYFAHDLKGLLAYLTVNVLGTLVMLLGVGTHTAIQAALVYMLAHALYKGALFLMAGTIDHQTHSRDLRQLSGLWRRMPVTSAIAVLASLSMAGVLPLFGYIAKELYFEAVWKSPTAPLVLTAVSFLASTFLIAGAVLVGIRPVFGPLSERVAQAEEGRLTLWLSPAILALAGVVVGLFPQTLAGSMVERAAGVIAGAEVHVKLALWHGVNVPLVLSIAALLAGVGLDLVRGGVLARLGRLAVLGRWGPERWYGGVIRSLQWVATQLTDVLQSGYLRLYVVTILATTVVLSSLMLGRVGIEHLRQESIGVQFHEALAAVLIVFCAVLIARATSRYRAVALLGVIGFSVSWIYGMFGAPDLAMTQIVVEALTVLLFVLAFPGLPAFRELSSRATRVRDAILAASVGLVMALMLLLVTGYEQQPPISEYFAMQSYREAHGRNVVNVILVDFRALDTLGEITVLATAATGVYTLVRFVVPQGASK